MTNTLTHYRGHLFESSCGALVDANRLMQEIDRELAQSELLHKGITDTAMAKPRKQLVHVEGTLMMDPETGHTIDISAKQLLLDQIRGANAEVREALVMLELAKQFFIYRTSSCIALRKDDMKACQQFSEQALDVAERFRCITGLNSTNDAVFSMRTMRSLGQLA